MLESKQCPECKRQGIGPKARSEFARCGSQTGGLQPWCKVHHRALNREWHEKNKTTRLAYYRRYVRTPRGWAIHALHHARREDRGGRAGVTITLDEVIRMVERALVDGYVTLDTEQPHTASLDQIIPNGGYSSNNTRVVPWWYNAAKHTFTDEQIRVAMRLFFNAQHLDRLQPLRLIPTRKVLESCSA